MRLRIRQIMLLGYVITAACAYESVIPDDFAGHINTTLTFDQIKDDPVSHRGAVLVLGGEVLSAKRFPDHTRLTVLQLPLQDNHEPVGDAEWAQSVASEMNLSETAPNREDDSLPFKRLSSIQPRSLRALASPS